MYIRRPPAGRLRRAPPKWAPLASPPSRAPAPAPEPVKATPSPPAAATPASPRPRARAEPAADVGERYEGERNEQGQAEAGEHGRELAFGFLNCDRLTHLRDHQLNEGKTGEVLEAAAERRPGRRVAARVGRRCRRSHGRERRATQRTLAQPRLV